MSGQQEYILQLDCDAVTAQSAKALERSLNEFLAESCMVSDPKITVVAYDKQTGIAVIRSDDESNLLLSVYPGFQQVELKDIYEIMNSDQPKPPRP